MQFIRLKNLKLIFFPFWLIDFYKNICKKYLPFWLRRRIRVITSSIIDLITFTLISLIYDLGFNLTNISILGGWTILSYIMGRYSICKFKNIDKLRNGKRVLKTY